MDFDKTRSAGYLANHLARLFAQHLAAGIAPLGLAPAQFMALLELWREDGLTQAELCARLDVEQATMAATLGRMARDGLIERRAHPSDRRAQTVHLTDRARALETPATTVAQAVNQQALSALPEVHRQPFVASLHRITEEMRRRRP
ncbi:MarR family winged helix-turn-helix transcriptional regulator [Frigidibacter mobilis]|uniref:Transcriptional regulator, MarR family protein n=1 Tax=Frigidibacter mobilis TaxID=1335048 RepID=A0A159Z6I1_9RHOB|nr:MarR family transcriptional regulator [Frigidibacter mobilis]AMY70108.1 transcriptional regulator, MarR family protein [Frigidibacter mobilis]